MEDNVIKTLTDDDKLSLQLQNSRLVSQHNANLLEINAKKHWDLFYKRNETRFFRDRHWTTREFSELLNEDVNGKKVLLEIGCGVGNLIFPLIEDNANFFINACDLSEKAVELVINNPLYNSDKLNAFQTDITTESIFAKLSENHVDIVTLIFVLSAIHPDKFSVVLENIYKLLKPGGCLLFRDYGLYDMAQIRFKAGHKISENFYMRQDGTRSYYFSTEELEQLAIKAGFKVECNSYVNRRTVNKKENVDVPRIFVQAKFIK